MDVCGGFQRKQLGEGKAMITREFCTLCDGILYPFMTTPPLPIHMGTTDEPFSKDVSLSQTWVQCGSCGCAQLLHLIPPYLLYSKNHNPGTVGDTWSRHHEEFSDYVTNWGGTTIVEVGANTGTLAKLILAKKDVESYYMVDPNVRNLSNVRNIGVINDFFAPDTTLALGDIDTFVHSHTMEHFYDVKDTLTNMFDHLEDGGRMIISVPLTLESLYDGYHNAIGFEHTYTTTIQNIEMVLGLAGFILLDITYFNDVNVFICAQKSNEHDVVVQNESMETAISFLSYSSRLNKRYSHITSVLKTSSHKPTFIIGAHLFSQIPLLEHPDIQPHITAILDNDPSKWGMRLYGIEGITICSPKILSIIKEPRVIVDAAQYTDEIIAELLKINPNTEIL